MKYQRKNNKEKKAKWRKRRIMITATRARIAHAQQRARAHHAATRVQHRILCAAHLARALLARICIGSVHVENNENQYVEINVSIMAMKVIVSSENNVKSNINNDNVMKYQWRKKAMSNDSNWQWLLMIMWK